MKTQPVLPHPGPLDVDPTGLVYAATAAAHGDGFGPATVRDVAGSMLDTAVNGLPVGAYDVRIVEWLRRQDIDVTATVASLLRRAWLAGIADGRRERVDEIQVGRAHRALLDAVLKDLEEARSDALSLLDTLDSAIEVVR